MASDRAFDLLLACSDWPRSEARNRAIVAAHSHLEGDLDSFTALAARHHLAILAADGLGQAGIAVPGALAELATRQRHRALQLAGEALRLIAALEREGVAVQWIKGPLLSLQVYGDVAMRQCVDLDLLVDWSDFRNAIGVLEAQGCRLMGHTPPWDDWRIAVWRRLAKDVALAAPGERICVELHHRLKSPPELLPGLGLAEAGERVALGGRSLQTFACGDLFAYLCVHASTSLWDRLKWLADIRALLAGLDEGEIAALQAHSRALGTERCTALGLLLCHRLWGQAIPPEIAAWPRRTRWLADLEAASIQRLKGGVRAHSSFANSLDRRRLRNLRADRAYRGAQLSEFVHDRELLETVRLPRGARALYFPLRLWLFMRRKLRLAPDPRFAKPL
jgi:hypothetical protein